MPSTFLHPSLVSFGLLAAYLVALAARSAHGSTLPIMVASLCMFACSYSSAVHLLGQRAALRFMAIALIGGWFAEQMGSSHGWFFGHYTYTDVLGPRLGDVPVVIPLMWFALTYAGYVMANLIVWQAPVDAAPGWGNHLLLSLLAAMIVTAFDLGADPYFVYTLNAWIMEKTNGAWFGETVQGFVGWVFVSFVIVLGFRLSAGNKAPTVSSRFRRHDALVPVAIYGSGMVFQMLLGHPVEVRSIAPFAMGIPLLCALAGYRRWVPASQTPDTPRLP